MDDNRSFKTNCNMIKSMSKIIRLSQPDCANTSPKSNNFNKNTHRHRHIYTHTHTRNYTIAITRLERAKFVNGSNPKGDTTYISVYKINKTFIFYMLFHMNITCDLDLSGDFFFFFFLLIHYKNDYHSVSGSFSGAGATAFNSFMTKVPIK